MGRPGRAGIPRYIISPFVNSEICSRLYTFQGVNLVSLVHKSKARKGTTGEVHETQSSTQLAIEDHAQDTIDLPPRQPQIPSPKALPQVTNNCGGQTFATSDTNSKDSPSKANDKLSEREKDRRQAISASLKYAHEARQRYSLRHFFFLALLLLCRSPIVLHERLTAIANRAKLHMASLEHKRHMKQVHRSSRNLFNEAKISRSQTI
jgi:hypothetical protein